MGFAMKLNASLYIKEICTKRFAKWILTKRKEKADKVCIALVISAVFASVCTQDHMSRSVMLRSINKDKEL